MGEPVTCTGPPHAKSTPFLSAPYAGYAEIASYFDHDQPDYAVDGKIILTTGLTVSGTPTYGSFPAYWSPQLRQYIYYDGHNGYDYDIAYQPVLAAAAGIVSYAAWESSDPYYGYGQMILIRHRYGYITLYGHLSKIMVTPGEHVQAGQTIAISGDTGHSTGPHLHFSVYHNCHVMDPYGWHGKGPDPLVAFNGESSTYLWKKGEAPEILNPLPGWPTYGSGVIPVPRLPKDSRRASSASSQVVASVPVTHLLLVRIPSIDPTSAALATSAFQGQVAQELRDLTGILTSFKHRGLVESYADLPSLAAVKVTGTMSPAELATLPGVASILGDGARDRRAALEGYLGALGSAIARPQDPTMFPATYLDSAWTWRLNASAEEGGSDVIGFTQPGAAVSVRVLRHSHAVGSATTTGDAESGAFVASVDDDSGHPFTIRPADIVEVRSGGRSTSIDALPLSISANTASNRLEGWAPPGTNIQATDVQSLTGRTVSVAAIARTGGQGQPESRFSQRLPGRVGPGDPLSVSLVEASGNSVFTLGQAPGFELTQGASTVLGWAKPNTRWQATASIHGRVAATGQGWVNTRGSLQIDLQAKAGEASKLRTDEHVTLSSTGGRSFVIDLPRLSGALRPGSSVFAGHAPPRSHLFIRVWNDEAVSSRTLQVATNHNSSYQVDLGRPAGPGSSVGVSFVSSSGNLIEGGWAVRDVVLHALSGEVTGHAAPGETLFLHAFNPHRRLIGLGVAATSPLTGSFGATLTSPTGGPIRLLEGDTVTVDDGQIMTEYRTMGLWLSGSSDAATVTGWTQARGRVSVELLSSGRVIRKTANSIDRKGWFDLAIPTDLANQPATQVEVLAGSERSGSTIVQGWVSDLAWFLSATSGGPRAYLRY